MLFKRAPKNTIVITAALVWAIASLLPITEAEAGKNSTPVVQQAQTDGGSTAVVQSRITPIVRSHSIGDPDDYATNGDTHRDSKELPPTIWTAIELMLNSIIGMVGGK